jgi:hypothetical protein
MRQNLLFILILMLAYGMSACGASATPNASPEPLSVKDQASLVSALKAAGATAEVGEPIAQDFFSVEGNIVKVNGADLQVFEYENAQAMEKDASNVAPDGGSIGTSMVDWIDTPHFYKAGRIITLYVGSDKAILELLNKVLGPQFAGR